MVLWNEDIPVDSICYGHWKKLASELNLGFAQLLLRIRNLCDRVMAATAESLSLPDECHVVLDLVKSRARKLVASLTVSS